MKLDLRDDTLHTAEEVASIIKSTLPSVRTMTSKGTIPPSVVVRIGRKTLYSRRRLENWLPGVPA